MAYLQLEMPLFEEPRTAVSGNPIFELERFFSDRSSSACRKAIPASDLTFTLLYQEDDGKQTQNPVRSVVFESECSATTPPALSERNQDVFLASIYLLSGHDDRKAADWVIDYIDDRLNEGEFAECDAVLKNASVDKLSDPLIVTLLGITLAARTHLRSRTGFLDRALAVVGKRRGDEAKARALLEKYR